MPNTRVVGNTDLWAMRGFPKGARLAWTVGQAGGVKLVVLLVLAMALGAGASYALFGRGKPGAAKSDKHQESAAETPSHEDEQISYVNMGSFLVNVVSNDGTLRYLRTELTLAVKMEHEGKKGGGGHGKEAKGVTLSPGDDVAARDAIVRALSCQTFEQLRADPSHARVKKALLDEVSRVVKDAEVVNVLITSFTMQ